MIHQTLIVKHSQGANAEHKVQPYKSNDLTVKVETKRELAHKLRERAQVCLLMGLAASADALADRARRIEYSLEGLKRRMGGVDHSANGTKQIR